MNSKFSRIFAILTLSAMLFSLTACGSTSETVTTSSVETSSTTESTEISGTITALADNSITVETESGDSIVFSVDDNTLYSYTLGDTPSGDMPQSSDSENVAPEMPSGNGQPSDMPQGDNSGSTPPEMPSGDNQPDGSQPPEMSQDNSSGNTPPEMPSGDNQPQDGSQPPEMSQDNSSGNTPPEMPSGDNQPHDNGSGNTPPEKPSGDNQSQNGSQPPEMPSDGSPDSQMPQDGNTPDNMQASFSSLSEGTMITAVLGSDGAASEIKIVMQGGFGNMGGAPGNDAQSNASYTALNSYDTDTSLSNESINSTGIDENAVLVTSGKVTIDNSEISRNSSDSTGGDNSSFYGIGATVLTTGGTVSVEDSTITSDAKGGAGVFAYGDGTAYVSDTTIRTTQNTSGGIHVAGGGTLYAWDLNVTTDGESSAAIRSDRGSGTMVVDGGSYTSNGTGSPAIYSTADITVNNAELTANNSEAICIEGKNSIRLYDCSLSGNMSDNDQNDCIWDVILYQSMSGDSEKGNSTFEMVDGKLTSENGGLFYTTNTQSTFLLKNVEITKADDDGFFLRCTGNNNARGWGQSGSNGANCTFTALSQEMTGDVIWDSISTLNFYMNEKSTFKGAFIQDESYAGNGGDGYAHLVIGNDCVWTVTKNSTLSSLECEGSIVDSNGNTVSIIGTDGTVYVQGTSNITVTVGSFSSTADFSGASECSSFSDFEVDRI